MTPEETIRALLAGASSPPPEARPWTDAEIERIAARCAWSHQIADKWLAAQRTMDERLDEAVDRLSEEEFERLCDEEEAKVDAFRGPLRAAAERDVWPKYLYWSL